MTGSPDHDDLCPCLTTVDPCACDALAATRADERQAEQAQREALARLLLDSGDITKMGARLLTKPRDGGGFPKPMPSGEEASQNG